MIKNVLNFLACLVGSSGIVCAQMGVAPVVVAPPIDLAELFKEQGLLPNSSSDGYLTFYFDNDLFAGNDGDYTNGARLAWISGSQKLEDFGVIQRMLRSFADEDRYGGVLSGILGINDAKTTSYNFGFSFTQLLFTPDSLEALSAPYGERPYAAWMGLGYSLHAKDEDSLSSIGINIGMIGPAALGEETQDWVHELRGFEKFQGWDSQFPNELTFDIRFDRKELLNFVGSRGEGFAIDGLADWGLALGTFRTNLHFGMSARFGYHLPNAFADPRLTLNAYSQEPFDVQANERKAWSFYGILGMRGRIVGYDASLDGPLFRNVSSPVNREWLVGEAYLGFGLRVKAWELSYVHTLQTREFEEDRDNYQVFGSFALRHRF